MESKKPNHICKVCGVKYYACESCDKNKTYKSMCESENHYKIYNIVIMYTRGVYSKEQAMNALSHCDLSDMNTYKESIVKIIDEINKVDETKLSKRGKRASVVIVDETIPEDACEEIKTEELDMNVID